MKTNKSFTGFLVLLLWLFHPAGTQAAFLRNVPQTVTLPDHSVVHCFASGDEYFNWLHDADGFTLIFANDGFLYYAIKDGDLLKPSAFRVNSVNPASAGIQPWNLISAGAYRQQREKDAAIGTGSNPPNMPHSGNINNIVVFIRFSDDGEYTELTSYYGDMFNSTVPNANSMHNYFHEASYEAVNLSASLFPTTTGTTVVSFQDSHPRSYYLPYNETSNPGGYPDNEKWTREHALLKAGVNAITSQVPGTLNVDGDNDGFVDNVCFILKGGVDAWNHILWPHCATMGDPYVYINGKMVKVYNVQLSQDIQVEGNGVLCHEMFHTFGAPDLYHYDNAYSGLVPVGRWDVMETNLNPPQHMGAWLKYKYGLWIPSYMVMQISSSGYYTLEALNSLVGYRCYRINSPFSATEFFIVEYRRKTGTFESSLPGDGMVIYRINSSFNGNGGYNGTDAFDEVYAYRPSGSTTQNGMPYYANYSQLVDRTVINCNSSPTPYLSQGGAGGIDIREITDHNGTLTFLLVKASQSDILLDQTNTAGVYVASNEIRMEDGFSTNTADSLHAIIADCPAAKAPSYPHFEFLDIRVTDQDGKEGSPFTIQSVVGDAFNPDLIRSSRDHTGKYLSKGTYKYKVFRAGTETGQGTIEIK